MNDTIVIIALSISAILVLGTCACLYLFISLKKEVYGLRKKMRFVEAEVKASLAPFESSSKKEEQDLQEDGTLSEMSRLEILKLSGRGKATAEIASVLNVPKNEADLLVRINSMVSQRA